MLRRFGILGVLLLSLSGVIPTVWACAVMAQHADCCPPGAPPCDKDRVPVPADLNAACCDAQSAPTQAVASIRVQKEDTFTDSPHPGQWIAIDNTRMRSGRSQRLHVPFTLNSRSGSDQQQLYLQTGRLRL